MARLFGFSIEDTEKTPAGVVSPVPPNRQDGSEYYVSSGFYGSYVDIEGVYRTENDLLRRYRQMSLYPECDSAIEDIVNEAIVSDTHDSPIEIELSNLNASDGIKKKIREEFQFVCELLDFDKKAHEIFRNWYIDGRLYYNKVIDQKDPHAGIQELRYIDASKMKYIRQMKKSKPGANNQPLANADVTGYNFPEIEEYFIYTPQGATTPYTTSGGNPAKGIKLTRDSITYCTSGLVDRNKGSTLSWLHKAIKPLNQLMMIEDSLVIYRLSRAPERRIFYIDVGNLPKVKAEQYLRDVMMRYRNKLVYDANTGEMRDDKKFMSMMEDFWLPRREGGRGTEITTLPGGQNLGEITDINYFQKKLYRSLNVPETRIAGGDAGFSLGRSSEILRDEVKFSKFVGRMRKRFTHLFSDILRTQLLLKNVCTPEDWEIMNDHIQYDFLYDNHFAELKDSELLQERLNLASAAEPYVGKYYSADYIRRKVLRQTDQEIIDQDKQIKKEIAKGVIPDPNAPIDPATGQPLPQTNGVLGKNTLEPEVEEEKSEAPETPSGGEI
ncbi:portal protein [Prochlorococcus phage P-TIM68]|uniref:Portal protein n=1 Tax=Prochlorococcus phage P-TIM68 TaxID=1542477 RepID=A0A0K0KVS4_9CAUD|nr:portal protein [Prochlorococcus phage P-TIM68]AIR93443.1 putative portal vertex protein of head [Prochlorococcus phage P-TIM68]